MSTALPLRSADVAAGSWRSEAPVTTPHASPRFLLWIDAVGGFLVCLGDEVRLGQAVPGCEVEVPLLADLARHHATVRRDNEGYVLEPVWETRLDGRRIEHATCLAEGSLIELGRGLQLRFRQPHALSATARLEVVSRHQTKPSTSGIILMSEACVLGPSSRCHAVCRHWTSEVVLLRRAGGLACYAPGTFEIDGQAVQNCGPVSLRSRICSEQFSLSLEEV